MVGKICLLSTLVVTIATISTQAASYRGHKRVRVYVNSPDELKHVHDVTKRSSDKVQYWNGEQPESLMGYLPEVIDLLTSPAGHGSLVENLNSRSLPYDVISHDIQSDLDDHRRDNQMAQSDNGRYFDSYHHLDEISAFLDDLVTRCPGHCETFEIGRSYEGRPLKGIKITGSHGPKNKTRVWIDAGLHAREWISHATAQYIALRLVEDYDKDDFVRELVDRYEWQILPCANPDGYNFTWETDRLWRKTRRPNPGSSCVGTDPNRNFDFKWGEVGVSSDPCTNNYMGPEPFSEPESRALADHLTSQRGSWEVYLTLHSKGQLIMCPWGYTDTPPQDYHELERVGLAMERGIYSAHGMAYKFGSTASILYRSAGTSRDWARGAAGIKYVYTIELRDRGRYGWMLPPAQIRDTGEEIWAGLKAGLREIMGGA